MYFVAHTFIEIQSWLYVYLTNKTVGAIIFKVLLYIDINPTLKIQEQINMQALLMYISCCTYLSDVGRVSIG